MADRLRGTARKAGVPQAGLDRLDLAHALAMGPRSALLADDHAPDFLHPGRTALILLLDLEEWDADLLAAALFVESERPELAVGAERVRDALGDGVADWVAAVPSPAAEDLVERLILADEPVQRIVLAERLDHLRHAHLWTDLERRRAAHEGAVAVYAPLADRVHPTLARRYRWWCGMFGRKYVR